MTNDQIAKRYPKLVRALQFLLIGSKAEAVSTIEIYKSCGADAHGCEACSHSGRTVGQAIRQAFNCRRAARDSANAQWRFQTDQAQQMSR